MKFNFENKTQNISLTVGVVGLGYVGLPLLLSYAHKGFEVIGFDIDEKKVEHLRNGKSYIKHIDSDQINEFVTKDIFRPTSDFSLVDICDVLVICVPTPLSIHWEPDLSYVLSTLEQITPFLHDGQLISLESTTYPGTTMEVLKPALESNGFKVGENLFLTYSPEREDPGNEDFAGSAIPKVIGGATDKCLKIGATFYGAVYSKVIKVSSPEVAEFTKLLENIYRAVNIGLVNEMKIVATAMGIDIWEVIEAAKTKPFGFTPFYPGPGLGGHCIPIDPFYLTWKAREYGLHTRFIELAGQINRSMPDFVLDMAADALNKHSKSLNGSGILLVGLAYKSNVDDMRESPTFHLMDQFKEKGSKISYFDPYIPEIPITREHSEWAGLESINWNKEQIQSFDCVVIVTKHDSINYVELAKWAPCIVDTRNAMDSLETTPGQVIKA